MNCADCNVDYPDYILSRMFVQGAYTEPICGLCAAARAGRRNFSGDAAEYNRLAAEEHRKQTGQRPVRERKG